MVPTHHKTLNFCAVGIRSETIRIVCGKWFLHIIKLWTFATVHVSSEGQSIEIVSNCVRSRAQICILDHWNGWGVSWVKQAIVLSVSLLRVSPYQRSDSPSTAGHHPTLAGLSHRHLFKTRSSEDECNITSTIIIGLQARPWQDHHIDIFNNLLYTSFCVWFGQVSGKL